MPSPDLAALRLMSASLTVFKSYAQPERNEVTQYKPNDSPIFTHFQLQLTNFRKEIDECTRPVQIICSQFGCFVVPRKDMMIVVPAFAHRQYTDECVVRGRNVSDNTENSVYSSTEDGRCAQFS